MRPELRKWLLPGGIVLAAGLAEVWPAEGRWLKDAGAGSWLIAVIFLVNGYSL
jgi:hypothetical protein